MAGTSKTLTNRQVESVATALRGLDGVADGKELRRFKFDADQVWSIAQLGEIFDAAKATVERARRALLAKYGIMLRMPITDLSAPKVALYQVDEMTLLDQSVVLSLPEYTLTREIVLAAGVNVPSIVQGLMPILTQ